MENQQKLVIIHEEKFAFLYRLFGVALLLVAISLALTLGIWGVLAAIPILASGAMLAAQTPLTLVFDRQKNKFIYYNPYPIYETQKEFNFFKKKDGERNLSGIKAIKHIYIEIYWFSRTYGRKGGRGYLVFLLKSGEQISFPGVYVSEAEKIAKFLGLTLKRGQVLERWRETERLKYMAPPANSPESQVDGRFDEPQRKITISSLD
jgi:hypothetical protein